MMIADSPRWMKEVIAYLTNQSFLDNKEGARKLRRRATKFVLQDGVLYKRGFSHPLLRCITQEEMNYVMKEIHEEICGPLPTGRGRVKFTVVAVDYFTKWSEAEPLAKITEENTWKFVWKNIVCRFGIPHSLVFDNGTQFTGKKFNSNYEERKLEFAKGGWAEELPETLWSYRTTSRTSTGETPFTMAFGTEAMIPIEIGIPSQKHLHFDEVTNDDLRRMNLDLQEERHADSQLRLTVYKKKMTRYYNSKISSHDLWIVSHLVTSYVVRALASLEIASFIQRTLFSECNASISPAPTTSECNSSTFIANISYNLQLRTWLRAVFISAIFISSGRSASSGSYPNRGSIPMNGGRHHYRWRRQLF
ncbi:Ribonuclease H [Abeliophyllum distichum]|uniref:Ribonuclease H n=1 Tax=Abeliophyllum distichum TaxID=126358 RepID=A0ABD1PDF1_9LAMI